MKNTDFSKTSLMQTTDLINFIGSRFTYSKGGSRHQWVGIITLVHPTGRVDVLYDNGVTEQYARSAFVLQSNATSGGSVNKSQSYLVLEEEGLQGVSNPNPNRFTPLREDNYLVINLQTGKIVGVETDEDEAEQFAQEQASDSEKKNTFAVFKATSVFALERPKAKKRGIFSTFMNKLQS